MSLYAESFVCGGRLWHVGQRVRWHCSDGEGRLATVIAHWTGTDAVRIAPDGLDTHAVTHVRYVEPITEGDLA